MLSSSFFVKHLQIIGLITILISIVAWITDWTGLVYVCPYCRVQRTVIGILGVLLLAKPLHRWFTLYLGSVFAFLGAHVAAAQHFRGWAKISSGKFEFNENIFVDSFLLSGCALLIITAQFWLLVLAVRHHYQQPR